MTRAESLVRASAHRLWRPFTRLKALDWVWLHSKIAAAAWVILLMAFTPNALAASWGGLLTFLIATVTVSGVGISLTGMVMAATGPVSSIEQVTATVRRTQRGLRIELIGLWWMLLGGIGTYTMTQFVLVVSGDDQRIALTGLGYWTASMLICRIVSVVHRRRKEARAGVAAGVIL